MTQREMLIVTSNYCVYMHIFPNGKRYIGLTMQKPERRWSNGRGYKDSPKMHKAIQKYGWENVEHTIIKEHLSKSQAEALEIRLIKEYDTILNGYNIEHGGNTQGTHNEETRRKISKAGKGKKKRPLTDKEKKAASIRVSGEKNPFYGKHHTEKVKKEHSRFMMGNQYNKGHHHSDEFKRMKSEQMSKIYSDGKHPRCKKIECFFIDGNIKEFQSVRDAARAINVSPASIVKYTKRGYDSSGNKWRYAI